MKKNKNKHTRRRKRSSRKHGEKPNRRKLPRIPWSLYATLATAIATAGHWYGSCTQHAAEQNERESSLRQELLELADMQKIDLPDRGVLAALVMHHRDGFLALLDSDQRGTNTEDAARLGRLVDRALGDTRDARHACLEKLEILKNINQHIEEGTIEPERVRDEILQSLQPFVYEELARCLVITETNYPHKALYVAGLLLGRKRADRCSIDPPACLSTTLHRPVIHLMKRFGLPFDDLFRSKAPVSVSPLKNLVFRGCNGYVSGLKVQASPDYVRGRGALTFTPVWTGGPGRDMTCIAWRSNDGSRALRFEFRADGTTTTSFSLEGFGKRLAFIPGTQTEWKAGKSRHVAFEWDLTRLDRPGLLCLRVGEVERCSRPDTDGWRNTYLSSGGNR